MVLTSPFRPYLDAAIKVKHAEVTRRADEAMQSGNRVNAYTLLMEFAREVFILGYSLKSLEEKRKKKEPP